MANRNSNRYRHRMRCGVTKCRTRFTLRKHPTMYRRAVKCPRCGDSLKVRNVEAERQRELAKQIRCYCPCYPFPHRRGSLRMCRHHPLASTVPTEEEELDYDACLATQRSGG